MSFSVEQFPSCSFLSKRQSMLPSTDSKSSFSDISANQKHLIKQMLHLVELNDVYFDEEMNLSIKKLIDFLQPTAINSLSRVNFTDMNTAEIKQVMNKASHYLETRLESETDQLKKIETEKITQDRINKRSRSIRNLFFDKQIVFSKEDTTAAHILYTLAAFANLLCQQPKLINRLVLVQICSSKIPAHELEAVPEIVRQINQLYGTTESVPVHFYHQEIDQNELLAFMNAAHIGLCLNASSAKEFALHTSHPSNTSISVQDPSNIPQLTEALQNALAKNLIN